MSFSGVAKTTILSYLSTQLIMNLTLFWVVLIAVCAMAALHSYIRSQNRIVCHRNDDIGCPKKKYSIKLKKKCTKKWRSPTRELKTWYVCNNIIVFLFMKKYFSILNFYGWYGHLNVKFWQFWHWPNVSKFCSKIVLCLLFLLQKKFPV